MIHISYERTFETMSINRKETLNSPETSIFRITCVFINIYVCTVTYIRPYVHGCENIHHSTDSICCGLDIRSAFPARWIGAVSKAIPQSSRGLSFPKFLASRYKYVARWYRSLLLPRSYPWYFFLVKDESKLEPKCGRNHSVNEKHNDCIGNRNRKLPACSALPQLTARQHTYIDHVNQGLTRARAVTENFEWLNRNVSKTWGCHLPVSAWLLSSFMVQPHISSSDSLSRDIDIRR